MRIVSNVCFVLMLAFLPSTAESQPKQKEKLKGEDFAKAKPAVGDPLPDLTVYSPDGKEVKTSTLKGNYTVLTFGCLT
jgi:cytochrome oxidase Cu insertion factor (SCO1/SenC/PrrC family)